MAECRHFVHAGSQISASVGDCSARDAIQSARSLPMSRIVYSLGSGKAQFGRRTVAKLSVEVVTANVRFWKKQTLTW